MRFVLWLAPAPVPAPAPADGATPALITDVIAPILGTGLVGALLLMLLFRIKIMPTYVHDEAKKSWDAERLRLESDIADLKALLRDANEVYTQQVIPTLTRVLDAERELVELRRDEAAERRRRGNQPA